MPKACIDSSSTRPGVLSFGELGKEGQVGVIDNTQSLDVSRPALMRQVCAAVFELPSMYDYDFRQDPKDFVTRVMTSHWLTGP